MASQPAAPPRQGADTESSLPYVAPFILFFVLLSVGTYTGDLLGRWEFPLRAVLLAVGLYVFSRKVINLRVSNPLLSILTGIAVFAIWIGPDLLIPGYRSHWLFQNSLTGEMKAGIETRYQHDMLVLGARSVRAIILVPIIEELFWRAWLLRWLVKPNFWTLPLGTFSWSSILISAVLFGSEHGMFWEVGILAGLAYNLLMVRTKHLGDCVLAHAITNGLLSAYVILYGQWQYWP